MNMAAPVPFKENTASRWITNLLAQKLAGRIGPRLPPPPRRWEQSETKGERHHHQKMRSKRLRQLKAIEAKKSATQALARRGVMYPSKAAVRREIAGAPHVYN